MEYIQEIPVLPDGCKSAITLGKFDGVHRGHQKLIRQTGYKGKANNWRSIVMAFSGNVPKLLTKEERRELLSQMETDMLIDCPLDQAFMHIEPDDFVKNYLVGRLHVAYLVVGPDFRFGYKRKGDCSLLLEMGKIYGFQVEVLEKEQDGPEAISSTRIRSELEKGNMEAVNRLLGYPWFVTGKVLHGRGMGGKLLFPTTNLIPPREKLLPPNGVYVTSSRFQHETFRGVTNIGFKPTVGESFCGVETYLYNCNQDLYGKTCRVEFYHFQRQERKFPSLEALKEQLACDIRECAPEK